ncbi:MAG: M10 family metallopeptidase C-terminal domain-containing protein [Hyphomicrobium sp.]
MEGGDGNDVIIANGSPNDHTGNGGSDVFVFLTSADIGRGDGYRDRILDFDVGDRIDLDEVSREFADQFEDVFEEQGIKKFVLIRSQDEFTRPGQMKLQYEDQEGGSKVQVLAGNTDLDSEAEFEIEFVNNYEVSDRDFYWHS